MTRRTWLAGLFAAPVPDVVASAPGKNEVKLTLYLDRKRCDPDDTIMMQACFEAKWLSAKLYVAAYSGTSLYFYLIYRDPRSPDAIKCVPLWERQFGRWPNTADQAQLATVSSALYSQQLAIHLPRFDLPPGEHALRVAYSRASTEDLFAAVEKATGHRPRGMDGIRYNAGPAELGWNEPVISPPVTITIDPPREPAKK